MDYEFLATTKLFKDNSPKEIQAMLTCMNAQVKDYKKGEIIFLAGESTSCFGLVIEGLVSAETSDFWGNKTVIDRMQKGRVFGETYACAKSNLLITVIAEEATKVLFLDINRLMQVCSKSCVYHNNVIRNLLSICAERSLNLSRKILHTTAKTIRGRLLSYFSFQAILNGKNEFTIPFNRQQLADYLGVDRSALSNELSKMQDEKLLVFKKNYFRLLKGLDYI